MSHILTKPDRPVDARRGRRVSAALAAALTSALGACAQSGGPEAGPIAQAPTEAPAAAAAAPSVDVSRPVRAALLVPLSAADPAAQSAARAIADGARLAAAERPGAIELDLRDTAGRPETAGAAAREAAAAGAAVVLGPLFGANAPAVAEAGRETGLTALSFSNTPSAAGDGVWLVGLLASSQADALLAHAARQGVYAVGVYHPDTPAGLAARDALSAAGPRAGVSVSPIVGYPRSFNGIQDSSRGYADAHQASGAAGVALPDRGQGLQAAGSFLNFHGVSARNGLFLGFADGAAPATLAENSLHGARFATPDPAAMAGFAARFQARFGRAPEDLAWIGYDAAAAVAQMVERARARGDATPFGPDDIAAPDGYEGAAGRVVFTSNGLNRRELAVVEATPERFLTLEGPGGTAPVLPPAETDPETPVGPVSAAPRAAAAASGA